MKLFNFDIHIGKWRVLVQTRDIADKAVTGSKILDRVIDWFHIKKNAIRNEHIDNEAVDSRTIADNAILNRHIKRGTIHADKFAPCVETDWLLPILNNKCGVIVKWLRQQIAEIRQIATSASKSGIALSNKFGSSTDIGITQKLITDEFGRVWRKLNELTGEPDDGIMVKINPDVFFSEDEGTVQVTAVARNKEFEKVRIYVNDKLAVEKEYTMGFVEDITLTETSVIRTVVQIMDVEYTDVKVVTKLFPFFIGSGTVWTDAETVDNAQVYKGLKGSYVVTVANDDDKIFVIIPKRLSRQMIRFKVNDVEKEFIKRENGDLAIYESQDGFSADTYNLEIVCGCDCNCNSNCTCETEEETEG